MVDNVISIYGEPIRYEFVEKPYLRNSYMRFVDDKLLVVSSSPRKASNIVEKHKNWILKHYKQIKSSVRMFDKSSVLFMGKRYPLAFRESKRGKIEVNPDIILVSCTKGKTNTVLRNWIKAETLRAVTPIVSSKIEVIGKPMPEINVRKLRKWGMCSSRGRITFNAFLSMLPASLSEYVVSHEVSHLKHMNHSREFWNTVAVLCPNYKQLRRELSNYDNSERSITFE